MKARIFDKRTRKEVDASLYWYDLGAGKLRAKSSLLDVTKNYIIEWER